MISYLAENVFYVVTFEETGMFSFFASINVVVCFLIKGEKNLLIMIWTS